MRHGLDVAGSRRQTNTDGACHILRVYSPPMKYILLVALGVVAIGCGGDSTPNRPTPAVVPLCQTNNSAVLFFENRSPLSRTFDLYLDGANFAVIPPTQTSAPFTVSAGVQHRVEFRLTNTNLVICSASPIPVQCSTQTYFCAF